MKKYLFVFLIISGIVLPTISFAGLPDFNGPFVICGRSSINQAPCTLCDIFKMAQLVIDLIIGLIIVIGPILIAVGGGMILLAGADPGLLSKGKSVIKNVIIGLIIALLAWTAIDMIFNKLTNTSVGPWNKIECSGGGINKDTAMPPKIQEGDICRCEWKDGMITTSEYGNASNCSKDCPFKCDSTGNLINRYCCVKSKDEVCLGGSIDQTESIKKQCSCETDVYDISPKDYPSKATVIAKDFKVTTLGSAEECASKCVIANKNSYCYSRTVTPDSGSRLTCYSQNDLEASKNVSCKKSTNVADQQLACYKNRGDCEATRIPEDPNYNKNCFIDGQFQCYCTQGQSTGCTPSNPIGLRLDRNETPLSTYVSVWQCANKNCDILGGRCGLLSAITPATEPKGEWCKRTAPSGSNKWQLSGINVNQKGDAHSGLAGFLNCMYGKNISKLYITSISEDALCSNPSCDTTKTKCGSHAINSCHYGGSSCTGLSRAVDFGLISGGPKCSEIKKAALDCNANAWVHYEVNHVHISIGRDGCGCAEQQTGKDCPSGE